MSPRCCPALPWRTRRIHKFLCPYILQKCLSPIELPQCNTLVKHASKVCLNHLESKSLSAWRCATIFLLAVVLHSLQSRHGQMEAILIESQKWTSSFDKLWWALRAATQRSSNLLESKFPTHANTYNLNVSWARELRQIPKVIKKWNGFLQV